jgi:hypothetical protein
MTDRKKKTEEVRPFGVAAIDRFLSECHVRHFPSKTVVIHAGDTSHTLYFMIEGSVAVVIEDENGNEIVLTYLNRGEFFGELGLFQDDPTRSAWVRTTRRAAPGYVPAPNAPSPRSPMAAFANWPRTTRTSCSNSPVSWPPGSAAPHARSAIWHSWT